MYDLRISRIIGCYAVLQRRRDAFHILQLQHQNAASGIRSRYHFRCQPAQNFQHLLPVGQYSVCKVDGLKLIRIHRYGFFFLHFRLYFGFRFQFFGFCLCFHIRFFGFRFCFRIRFLGFASGFRFLGSCFRICSLLRFFYIRRVFIVRFPALFAIARFASGFFFFLFFFSQCIVFVLNRVFEFRLRRRLCRRNRHSSPYGTHKNQYTYRHGLSFYFPQHFHPITSAFCTIHNYN